MMKCKFCNIQLLEEILTVKWPEIINSEDGGYEVVCKEDNSCHNCYRKFYSIKGEFVAQLMTAFPWDLKDQKRFIENNEIPFMLEHFLSYVRCEK